MILFVASAVPSWMGYGGHIHLVVVACIRLLRLHHYGIFWVLINYDQIEEEHRKLSQTIEYRVEVISSSRTNLSS